MTQMNSILEVFVDQHNRYWGDNTSYRFFCKVEGGLQDASELSAGGERLLKHNFQVTLNGYLIVSSANTGTVEKFKKIGGSISVPPIISKDSLYLITESNKIYGFR